MRISINITDYSWTAGGLSSQLARIVRAADEAGLDTVWVPDHLLQCDPNSTWDAEMLEAYTTLGFLAAHSERVRLGTMVTGNTFRAPALLIKTVTTLDALSGGRAWLGIGAGYQQDEARAMGLPFPPVAERFGQLEETLQLATRMWAGDASAFEGGHYQLARPISSPRPVARPRPPILIGGMGEHRTLRLVADYADACNLFDVPDGGATLRHKLAVLAEHCRAAGRPYDAIDKTVSTFLEPGASPDAVARRCEVFAELGIEHVVVITTGPWTEAAVADLGSTTAALAGTG